MAEVLVRCGVKRAAGYLYFIDKKGNVARTPMARAGKTTSRRQEVLVNCHVRREKGYLYFLDKNGNVARTRMARGGHRKKKR